MAVVAEWACEAAHRVVVQAVVAVLGQGVSQRHPEPGCGEMYHRIGEHNGYTLPYLPVSSCKPPLPRNPEASRAIFAARMAFSSFVTLPWLI